MPPSNGSGSQSPPAPKRWRPRFFSRSRERSAKPLEAATSRPAIAERRDLAVPLPVELARRGAESILVYATDLSVSGMRVQLAETLAAGEVVELRATLPGEAAPVEARGRVSWCEDPPPAARASLFEAGVRFERLAESDRERIARFVRGCDPAHIGPG